MLWSDFLAACALFLVLEGILPFLNPAAMKRVLQVFASQDERRLRAAGLTSMAAGALLLYLIRG